MYFLIGRWGHGDARRAALKFFLYTLAGSLVMLLAILGALPGQRAAHLRHARADRPAAAGRRRRAAAVLAFLGLVIGLAIKTPLVPVHTWLPPAHVDAPGPASAILAGVLLKMGTYGMIRIPLHDDARDLRALGASRSPSWRWCRSSTARWSRSGRRNLKRRIAYTSVNHMGYTVLGIAAAGALGGGAERRARRWR